jgi:hypothetical protein
MFCKFIFAGKNGEHSGENEGLLNLMIPLADKMKYKGFSS